MDHRCDCERGGNCTRTTMCHVQSVVDDLNGEHEIEIERLTAENELLREALKPLIPEGHSDYDCVNNLLHFEPANRGFNKCTYCEAREALKETTK